MKGISEVNQKLNNVLKIQLTSINQFFLHARMCKNWGLNKLNEYEYHYSIDLMKQADQVIERILFLEGLPNLQSLGNLLIGEQVTEILTNDLTVCTEMRQALIETINFCESQQDYITRELSEKLLEETEEQIDWLESQQWLISNSGLENYLTSVSMNSD